MLGSISPVGETSRRQRWWLTATAYTAGSLLGGAATGAVLGGVGWLLQRAVGLGMASRLWLLAAVVAMAALIDTGLLPLRLPAWRRQVDERWLTTYRGWVYGLGFGVQLGAAVMTIIPAAGTYAMLAACVLTASPAGGMTIGLAFGLVRSIPLLLTARLRTAAQLHVVTSRVVAAQPQVHRLTAGGQALVALVAVAVGVLGLA